MTALDWAIVVVYLVGLITLSYWLSKGQVDQKDYYLGGRTMSWRSVGLSTMATQLSAISFISAPAFVGLREGGGMKWLTYEFGVPLAMILLIIVVIPTIYRSNLVSIYEYLEKRYSGNTRVLVSLVFQLSRGLATGVGVYALGLVLSAVLGLPLWMTILITGGVTIVYDMLGGMKAVVYSDVIQMGIIFFGILLCSGFALHLVGGWQAVTANLDAGRFTAVDFGNTGLDGQEFGFWPMVLGGLFLYASYYGTDQSQAQRWLSCRSLGQARLTLLFNGLARFPLVFLYSIMGLLLGTLAVTNARFMALVSPQEPDLMVPNFIIHFLPAGLTGILIVAILAATMSSLDSALNSLSAASMRDIVMPYLKRPISDRENLLYSKLLTLFWGIVACAMAFFAGDISPTVIEAINLIGSLFYGPILAVFLLGIVTRNTHALAANVGLIAGVLFNFGLWLFARDTVFWFWWNATGALVTIIVGYGLSLILEPSGRLKATLSLENLELRRRETAILLGSFLLMVIISVSLKGLFFAG